MFDANFRSRAIVPMAIFMALAISAPVFSQAGAGLFGGLNALPLLDGAKTRSVCAENPTGEKGKGGMAVPNPDEVKPAASARAADALSQGWKVRPFLRVNAGETATLMDVAGPGAIQHIWMAASWWTRALVLKVYWDGEAGPSIETPVPDFFAVGHEKIAKVTSLAVVVNPSNALNCYWAMPFRKHARFTLTNELYTEAVVGDATIGTREKGEQIVNKTVDRVVGFLRQWK